MPFGKARRVKAAQFGLDRMTTFANELHDLLLDLTPIFPRLPRGTPVPCSIPPTKVSHMYKSPAAGDGGDRHALVGRQIVVSSSKTPRQDPLQRRRTQFLAKTHL
jgi:hypothetical protein